MATLYLDRGDIELRAEGGALAIYASGERRGTVPLALLDRVVLRGAATLTTGVLGALAEQGIGLIAFAGRKHERISMLVGRPHADVRRRLAQAAHYLDASLRVKWSREIVTAKLDTQMRLLQRALGERADCRKPLTDAIAGIGRCREQLLAITATNSAIATFRGIEGAASAAYFGGLTALFPPSLAFTGRNRRPPRDPVNACLSLGYTLLHAETALACYQAGLDPLLGLYHEPDYGRESLASDLMEPLRPHVDRFVWGLFRARRLESAHFGRQGRGGGALLLGKAGRQIFYTEWEHMARPLRRLLRRITMTAARRWVGECSHLVPAFEEDRP